MGGAGRLVEGASGPATPVPMLPSRIKRGAQTCSIASQWRCMVQLGRRAMRRRISSKRRSRFSVFIVMCPENMPFRELSDSEPCIDPVPRGAVVMMETLAAISCTADRLGGVCQISLFRRATAAALRPHSRGHYTHEE